MHEVLVSHRNTKWKAGNAAWLHTTPMHCAQSHARTPAGIESGGRAQPQCCLRRVQVSPPDASPRGQRRHRETRRECRFRANPRPGEAALALYSRVESRPSAHLKLEPDSPAVRRWSPPLPLCENVAHPRAPAGSRMLGPAHVAPRRVDRPPTASGDSPGPSKEPMPVTTIGGAR